MRVVTWNTAKRLTAVEGLGAALAELRGDVVLLQAVTRPQLDRLRPAMRAAELHWVVSSIDEACAAGKYAANVVASRWRCRQMPSGWAGRQGANRSWVQRYNRLGIEMPAWDGLAPRPWLLLRVQLDSPWGLVDLVNAHVPAQARNRWDKVKAMVALGASLEAAEPGLRIVGGDFSSPRKETPEGMRGYGLGHKDRGKLWEEAELTVLGPAARHGLRDAFRAIHPLAQAPREGSCLCEGAGLRRFDHLLVSSHFLVESAEYRRQWMDSPSQRRLSDHAPLVASFEVRLVPVGPGYSTPRRPAPAPMR